LRFRLVQELAADGVPVAVACRVLRVSTSGYYEWRGRAPSARALADAELSAQIIEIHTLSRAPTALPGCMPSSGLGVVSAADGSGSRA
jgi:putative transposase